MLGLWVERVQYDMICIRPIDGECNRASVSWTIAAVSYRSTAVRMSECLRLYRTNDEGGRHEDDKYSVELGSRM